MGTIQCKAENATNSSLSNGADEGLSDAGGTALGLSFALLSCLLTTVGTILQKRAHTRNFKKPREKRAREFHGILLSFDWLLAVLMMVFMPLPMDFVALNYLALSVLAPLAGVTIVLNQVLAPCILGEKISKIEIYATFIILVGVMLTSLSGEHTTQEYSICEILDLYAYPGFISGLSVMLVMMATCIYLLHFMQRPNKFDQYRVVAFAFLAGAFGSISTMMLKATSLLAFSAEGGWDTLHPYYHFVIVITCAVSQITHINLSLKEYTAVVALPLYNAMYVVCNTAMGAVYYQEFSNYDLWQWVVFPSGCVITLSGMLLMAHLGTQDATVSPRKGMKTLPSKQRFFPEDDGDAEDPASRGTGNPTVVPFDSDAVEKAASGSAWEEEK